MKYRVVTSHSPTNLSGLVQLKIDEGWTPLGGVSVAADTHLMDGKSTGLANDLAHKMIYAQAMTKEG